MRFIFFYLALFFFLFTSCDQNKESYSTLSGSIEAMADPSFFPIAKAEEAVFESFYEEANVDFSYLPQNDIIKLFLKDSVNFILTGRRLSVEEKQFLQPEVPLTEIHFATDALAFLVHPSKLSVIDIDTLRSILTGKINNWQETGIGGEGAITLVTDESNSSNLLFLRDSFNLNTKINIIAAGSNEMVIEYVSSHPESIGIVASGFVADEEDPVIKKRRQLVQILKIKAGDNIYTPFQADIANENNPLKRKIYAIRRNRSKDVGVGFMAFISGEKGQRIVLKSGLLPANMPGREIKISED